MRILFVSPSSVSPFQNHGAGQRSYNIINALSDFAKIDIITLGEDIIRNPVFRNSNINYLGFVDSAHEEINRDCTIIRKLKFLYKSICYKKYFVPKNTSYSYRIDELIRENKYDFIFVRFFSTIFLAGLENNNNLILDIDDNPIRAFKFQNYRSQYFILGKIYSHNLEKILIKLLKKAYCCFFSNRNDIEKYKNLGQVHLLPNIPPITNDYKINKRNSEQHNRKALFVGSMSYSPNYEGVEYFIRNVLPSITREIPDFEFNIVGKDLPRNIIEIINNTQGVNYLGYIQNLCEIFNQCSIYISPVYQGAGTNIKILEAIKYKIPIVSTKISLNGYEDFLFDSKNIFIANNDKEFSNKIIDLLKNKEKRDSFSLNAYEALQNSCFTYNFLKNKLYNILVK